MSDTEEEETFERVGGPREWFSGDEIKAKKLSAKVDLDWKLTKQRVSELQEIHKVKEFLNAYDDIEFYVPCVSVVGWECSGKSTIINRIVGACVSLADTNTVTIVPIYFHLAPPTKKMIKEDSDFELQFNNQDYNKSQLADYQETFCKHIKTLKSGANFAPQHVKIYGTGLPFLDLIDLPGVRAVSTGPNDPAGLEHRLTRKHLNEQGSRDLIILVHSIDTTNPIDEVAKEISTIFEDKSGSETESGKRNYVENLIAEKRILCIGTCMDCVSKGTGDKESRTWNQMKRAEERVAAY